MNQFAAFITCLFSTLLLIPFHGECSGIGECEPEFEVEYILSTSTETHECTADYRRESFLRPILTTAYMPATIINTCPVADTFRIPLSILLCNFRE